MLVLQADMDLVLYVHCPPPVCQLFRCAGRCHGDHQPGPAAHPAAGVLQVWNHPVPSHSQLQGTSCVE